MNENNNDVKIVAFDIPKSTTKRSLKNKGREILKPQEKMISETGISSENKTGIKKFSNLFLIIGIIAIVVIIISVCLAVFLSKKNKKKNANGKNGISEFPVTPNSPEENDQLLKPIYKFNNTVGDLKRINVLQTSNKNITINGQTMEFLIHRNTTYDIYIMSVESPDEKNKNFYTNKYTASINVVKECYSFQNENCEPQDYIDFSSNEDNNNNLRYLEEITDLKDIPLPVCLFNFTDNDAITSFKCPESLPESKKNEMILDLYFFRPPAIERPEMDNPLKNATIESTSISNGKFTRERNSGICDVKNPLKTHCTTDMNTTTDKYDNLVTYDEIAYSNFYVDENNSFVKNKVTHLKDITDETKFLNKEAHKKLLSYTIEKLEPYIKYDEYFSTEDFQKLHSSIKGNPNKNKLSKRRNLNETFSGINPYIKEESLFFAEIDGVNVNLKLINDIGIGEESMTASSELLFDDNISATLDVKFEQTHLNSLLEELIILSKARNSLANKLHDQIKQKLNDITKNITLTIKSLNDFIVYENLVSIFDSSMSIENLTLLPTSIISQSEHLFILLRNKIDNTNEITEYKNTLNTIIYNFLYESHNYTNVLFEKIRELGKKMGSRNGKLVEIATYYLNHTSDSYTKIVSKAEDILKNYYINEKVLISNEINSLMKSFEENVKNSVKKEIGIIENIKTKLENKKMTISLSDENDVKNVISYLNKSITTISDIISIYKEKIESSLDLKKSGYFISDYEIESFQKRVNETIKEANENAQKFDNDDLIDKVYDKIMTNFRQNFTELKNYMNNRRDENFIMDENVLRNGKFTQSETEKITTYLNTFRANVTNEIIDENNKYKSEVTNKINNLVSSKKESLNQLIKNVDALFSEPVLVKLSNLYTSTFENSFELIKKQINNNKQLSYQYLDYLYQVLSKDANVIIHIDPYFKYKLGQVTNTDPNHYTIITKLQNYIRNRKIAQGFLIKYDYYSSYLDSSEDYINNQMNIDLFYQYKDLVIKLKLLLQSVKNNKFNDKYGDSTELTFINDNIRIIDDLYTRLDKYFSESLYNNYYQEKFNKFKQNEIQEIQTIRQALNQKKKLLTDKYTISNDKTKDFCAAYTQAATHTCSNSCIWTLNDSGEVCVNLNYYSNNHNLLVMLSIKSENNLQELETEFNNFYSMLNQNISEYNNVLTTLKNEITSLENDAINMKGKLSGLNNINEYINNVLNQKYGNILIKDSYDFYKKNLENKLENFLNNINEKWIESFKKTESEINLNKNNFKNQADEFYIMAIIYINLISTEIIYEYTDSIVTQQKNEFNYTISYYYNYLYTSVNKTYQYIIGKISTYNDGSNNILNYRKNQVIEKYNEIMQIIKDSENKSLNEENQINLLKVTDINLFNVSSIITDKINYLVTELTSLADTMNEDVIDIDQEDTAYSISARLYLENSENGKILEELTDSINRVSFVNLNLEKFKELIDNYIILDQENLIGCVNKIISQSTLEISTRYQRIREIYYDQLENEIKKYFTKDSLVEKIYSIYKNGINNLDESSRNSILLNVNEILEVIINYIKSESNSLSTNIKYNSNYEIINQTIKNYKEQTFNKVKNEMTNLFETLKKNMYDEIYTNYVEKSLNEYLTEVKNTTSRNRKFKEYKTLGASFKIGDNINEIAEDLSNQYKFIAKEAIGNAVIKSDYYNALNLEGIEKLINEKIESAFTSYLLPALKKYAIYDVGDGFYSYDLSDEIKNDIDSIINKSVEKIKKIMNTTKGEKYEFQSQFDYHEEWKLPDFYNIRRLLEKNATDFELYFNYEIDEELKMFNNSLKNSVKSNFNKMLDNFIKSFGDKFFEKISEYNLLNNINNLLNNFEYSFIQSYFYFDFLLTENDEFKYTRDLKYKVIKMNDIDLIIEQNKGVIIEAFNSKINDFINETGSYLVKQYISYMPKDEHNIEFTNMNEELKNLIIASITNSKNDIENEYHNSLQNHLKNPVIEKYEKIIEEISNDLITSIKKYQQSVSSNINEIETIKEEEDLIEISKKINLTLEQIDNYNSHFKQFYIPENIKKFLSSYGDNSIHPSFNQIIELINKATKDIIYQNLNENSDKYEKKLNIDQFYKKANESCSFLNNSYISPISTQILLYDAKNYATKLEYKKEEIKKKKRNLENLNTEDNNKQDYSDRVADKPLDDTFSKLLETADSVQDYVDSLDEFNRYDTLITKYINDVKIAVTNSSQLIGNYGFEENIVNTLDNKLSYLGNISLSYYNNVNVSFSITRDYIKTSIKKINDELKKCANATYETFANNYINILNNENYKSINKIYSETEEEVNTIQHNSKYQNGGNTLKVDITNLRKYSEFKFEIKYEEIKNIKKPIIFARITNKNLPRKMNIKSYDGIGNNGKYGLETEVNFNNASYTTILNFDTKATNINVTTLVKFEEYKYSTFNFTDGQGTNCTKCKTLADKTICWDLKGCIQKNETGPVTTIVDAKESNNTEILIY